MEKKNFAIALIRTSHSVDKISLRVPFWKNLSLSFIKCLSLFVSAFPKPDPVTNVTLDSLVYDGNHDGNKLLMTSSWKAPKG